MDGNYNNQQYNQQYNQPPQSYKGSNVPVVLGIISIALDVLCCGNGFIFGIIGLVFAVLNKNSNPNDENAKLGMILSIIGLGVSVLMSIIATVTNLFGIFMELLINIMQQIG